MTRTSKSRSFQTENLGKEAIAVPGSVQYLLDPTDGITRPEDLFKQRHLLASYDLTRAELQTLQTITRELPHGRLFGKSGKFVSVSSSFQAGLQKFENLNKVRSRNLVRL